MIIKIHMAKGIVKSFFESHPLFTIIEGEIERWERISENQNGRALSVPHGEPGKRRPGKRKMPPADPSMGGMGSREESAH